MKEKIRQKNTKTHKFTPVGIRERLIHVFRVRDAEEDSADVAGSVTKGATGLKRILIIVLHLMKTVFSVILLPIFIVIAIVLLIIALIVGIIMLIIYCSPLSIFFPMPDTGTPDIRVVLSGYYQELSTEISSYETEGMTVTYQNTENGTYVSNFRDTLMVYMTLYSDGTTGFVMDEAGQANLKKVFDEMNYIERDAVSEGDDRSGADKDDQEKTDEKASVGNAGRIIVHNLTYQDYIAAHTELNDDQKKMLDLLMTEVPSGYSGGTGIGEQVVALGMTKLGCRYSQARRFDEGYYDCSSFVLRMYGEFGLELPGTAAEQGRYCVEHGMLVNLQDLRPGDLIFYSYEENGRYKNISHVAIYAGDGRMIHAANIVRGVVMDPIRTSSVVFCGRPYLG